MIDDILIIIYLLTVLIIGLYNRTGINYISEYSSIKSDFKISRLSLIATIFANAVGGGTVFGLSEKAFTGTLAYTYGVLFSVLVDIIIAVTIVPKLIKTYSGALSVGELMVANYGNKGKIITGFAAIFTSIGYLAAQILVGSYIFQNILKINFTEGIILSYIIIIIYTAAGGLRSIIGVNLLQFFAMIITIPLISALGIYKIGFMNFIHQVPTYKYSMITNPNLIYETIEIAIAFSLACFSPSFIQKILFNRNEIEVKKAIITKSIIYVCFITIITINGLVVFILHKEHGSALTISYFISMIPIGIKGLIIIGLLAATMSTADNDLNTATSSIVNDVIKPLMNIKNPNTLLLAAQVITVIVGCLSIYLAMNFNNNILELVIFISGFWAPMILVPLIASFYNISISHKEFIYCAIFGIFSFTLWELFIQCPIKGVFIGTLVNLICFIFFKLRTKHKSLRRG